MSVKRYQPVAQCVEPSYQAQMVEPKVMEFSEGEYVRWEDYDATCETLAHTETERDASDAEVQRLKAEVERLTLENSQYEEHHKYGQNVIKGLREQVERLTKAGDGLEDAIIDGSSKQMNKARDDWHAAKEGKDGR